MGEKRVVDRCSVTRHTHLFFYDEMGRNLSQYKRRNANLASETRAGGDEEEGGKAPKGRHKHQNCPQVVLTIQLG